MTRAEIQSLYIRICQDSRFQLDFIRATQLTAAIASIHPLEVLPAFPSLSVMASIASGTHPKSHGTPPK
jgi:hypothetical protein